MGKIFGIGLSKTGTTSLNSALEILGYSAVHYPRTLKEIDSNDAATDITVTIQYKRLDEIYPGSKFILTTRNIDDWVESMRKHYQNHSVKTRSEFVLDIRRKMWGTIHFEEDKLKEVYKKHIKEVREYFKNRDDDLLILNICNGEGWEKLCDFLDEDIPKHPFPKDNVSAN